MKTIDQYQVEGLNKLSKQVNAFVKNIGFDNADVPLRIAYIHSELSEAFEVETTCSHEAIEHTEL